MYVRHMSFRLDQKIVLATVFTLGGLWNIRPHWLVKKDRDQAFPQGPGGNGRRLSEPNGTPPRIRPQATVNS